MIKQRKMWVLDLFFFVCVIFLRVCLGFISGLFTLRLSVDVDRIFGPTRCRLPRLGGDKIIWHSVLSFFISFSSFFVGETAIGTADRLSLFQSYTKILTLPLTLTVKLGLTLDHVNRVVLQAWRNHHEVLPLPLENLQGKRF